MWLGSSEIVVIAPQPLQISEMLHLCFAWRWIRAIAERLSWALLCLTNFMSCEFLVGMPSPQLGLICGSNYGGISFVIWSSRVVPTKHVRMAHTCLVIPWMLTACKKYSWTHQGGLILTAIIQMCVTAKRIEKRKAKEKTKSKRAFLRHPCFLSVHFRAHGHTHVSYMMYGCGAHWSYMSLQLVSLHPGPIPHRPAYVPCLSMLPVVKFGWWRSEPFCFPMSLRLAIWAYEVPTC